MASADLFQAYAFFCIAVIAKWALRIGLATPLLIPAQAVIAVLMPQTVSRALAFYVYPYTIAASLTLFLITGHAFSVVLSRHAPELNTILPPFAVH